MKIASEVRGAGLFGDPARKAYRALIPGDILYLVRDPHNAHDPNAIQLFKVDPRARASAYQYMVVGFLAREAAARIAPRMDRGEQWQAQVTAPPRASRYAQLALWEGNSRGSQDVREKRRAKI